MSVCFTLLWACCHPCTQPSVTIALAHVNQSQHAAYFSLTIQALQSCTPQVHCQCFSTDVMWTLFLANFQIFIILNLVFFNNGHSLYSQIANISFSSISKRQRWNPPLPCGLQIAQRTYRKMINACTYYCFLILSHWWKLSLLMICSPYLSCFPLLLLHMKLFHTGNRQTSEWAWSSRRRRQWAPFIMLNYAPFRPLSSCDLEIYPLRHRGGDLIP